MPFYFPFLALVLSFAVTILGGRTLWVWLAFCLSLLCLWAAMLFVTWDWAHGGTGWPLASLFSSRSTGSGLQAAYYIIEYVKWLCSLVVPCLIMAALLVTPQHMHRSAMDIGLFWLTVIFVLAATLGPQFYLNVGGMPGHIVDYEATIHWMSFYTRVGFIMALSAFAIAAFRPTLSWWRSRRATA